MTPQELEHWVLLASDVSSQQRQWEATSVLTEWAAHDSTAVVRTLLEVIPTTQQEAVLFYALTSFQRSEILQVSTMEQRRELRHFLLSISNSDASRVTQTFLKTKMGVVLANLIRFDFPHAWPDAFDQLRQQASPDLYCRTLDAFLEDLDLHADKDIKDMLRGLWPTHSLPPQQSISAQLLETLVSYLAQSLQQQEQQLGEQVSLLALSILKRLMPWVELTLVLDERVLGLLFVCLQSSSSSKSVGESAVLCLHELMGRGMDSEKKVALLMDTDLLGKLHASVNLETLDASPIEVVIPVAKLIDATGQELLPLVEDTATTTTNYQAALHKLWPQLLDLFLRCFAYDDIDVSGAVTPLATRLAASAEKNNAPTNGLSLAHLLPQLLTIMFRQMRYPADFKFDHEDDDEAEEEMYRSELRKLYQRLVRAQPDLCLQFLCQALANLPVPISSSPMPDLEAALRLVFHYCEGIRPPPGMKVVMKNDTFVSILVALHGSDVMSHPHREVLLLYYDVVVRYYPLFLKQPELLPKVLEGLSGTRGLQHAHPHIRSRSSYLLLRLVKSVVKVMRPYVETAVTGIQGLLSNSTPDLLRPDDVLYLFETIGLLLGRTGLTPQQQQHSLTSVMTPHMRSMEAILQAEHLAQDPEYYGDQLAKSIAAIAFLSKGFHKPPPEVQSVQVQTLGVTLAVLKALPGNANVRSKTMILLQRMILCLDAGVLPFMPGFLAVLIHNCNVEDIQDVAQLLVQICLKFKENAVPAMDAALLPFLGKCHELVQSLGSCSINTESSDMPPPPHLQTEQLSVKKLTYSFLQHLVSNSATAALLSPTNAGNFENVLAIVKDGAALVEDAVVKKACLTFFGELCRQWLVENGNDGVGLPLRCRLVRFLSESLVPAMIKCMLEPSFDERDAVQARNVLEFAQILFALKSSEGRDEYEHFVIGQTLSSVGCPASLLQAFRSASTGNEMEACCKALLEQLKPSTRG